MEKDQKKFHMKLEKWNFGTQGRKEVICGNGGQTKIKFWARNCFEAIGSYYRGLLNISSKTLNMLNASEAINSSGKEHLQSLCFCKLRGRKSFKPLLIQIFVTTLTLDFSVCFWRYDECSPGYLALLSCIFYILIPS